MRNMSNYELIYEDHIPLFVDKQGNKLSLKDVTEEELKEYEKIQRLKELKIENDDTSSFTKLGGETTIPPSEQEKRKSIDREVSRFNSHRGKNPYFHCEKCNDRRNIAYPDYDAMQVRFKQCDCVNRYKICSQLDMLGLYEFSQRATFDNYKINELWQEKSKKTAMEYVNNYQNKWFFIGGNVGSGKTHLCTAIVLGILEKQPEISVQYFKWDDSIKDLVEDDPYGEKTKDLKDCDVLYLDDFFRLMVGPVPRITEVRKAKEILDYRYMKRLSTIISSELSLDQIIDIDQAVGSRIVEMSRHYKVVYVQTDDKIERNVRMNPNLIKGDEE